MQLKLQWSNVENSTDFKNYAKSLAFNLKLVFAHDRDATQEI